MNDLEILVHFQRELNTLKRTQVENSKAIAVSTGSFFGRVVYFFTGENHSSICPLLRKIASLLSILSHSFKKTYELQCTLLSKRKIQLQRKEEIDKTINKIFKQQVADSLKTYKLIGSERDFTHLDPSKDIDKQLIDTAILAILTSNLKLLIALEILGVDFKNTTLLNKCYEPDQLGYPALLYPVMSESNSVVRWLRSRGMCMSELSLCCKRKCLAHIFGIEGKSKLGLKEGRSLEFTLQGFPPGGSSHTIVSHLIKAFSSFSKDYQKTARLEELDQVESALKQVKKPFRSLEEIRLALSGKESCCCFLGGFKRHKIAFVIANNQLMVCNRGLRSTKDSGICVYPLSEEKISEPLIYFLQKIHETKEEYEKAFEQLLLVPEKTLSFKEQKGPHCSWTSLKCAVFGLLLARFNDFDKAKQIYKAYTHYVRRKALVSYIPQKHDGLWQTIAIKVKSVLEKISLKSDFLNKEYAEFEQFKLDLYFIKNILKKIELKY